MDGPSEPLSEGQPEPAVPAATGDATASGSPMPVPPTSEFEAESFDTAELFRGFHAAHRRIGEASVGMLEASANIYALAEVLIRKGLIGLDELERARGAVATRLEERARESLSVQVATGAPDKYAMAEQTVEIDCENRVHLCKAACCRLRFALSEQDVEEGVVNWSIAEPYLNRQTGDGYCSHSDRETRRCTVYAHRPAVCRGYDCRQDHRIWVDFEKRIANPRLLEETNATATAGERQPPMAGEPRFVHQRASEPEAP